MRKGNNRTHPCKKNQNQKNVTAIGVTTRNVRNVDAHARAIGRSSVVHVRAIDDDFRNAAILRKEFLASQRLLLGKRQRPVGNVDEIALHDADVCKTAS